MSDSPKGVKHDSEKNRYDLIPPHALDEFVRVLTFGAQKYSPDNWRFVPEAERRYFAAAQRHLWAFKRGEIYDPESGIHHIAHAITSLSFLYELKYANQSGNTQGPGESRLDQSQSGN
jgi:hypothetical protein